MHSSGSEQEQEPRSCGYDSEYSDSIDREFWGIIIIAVVWNHRESPDLCWLR